MKKMIISCKSDSSKLCLEEIKNVYTRYKFLRWLDKGIGLIEIEDTFEEVSELFRKSNLIYLNHIFEVNYVLDLDKNKEEKIKEIIEKFSIELDYSKTFAIQGFIIVGNIKRNEINDLINNGLTQKGFLINNRVPKQVISYVAINNTMYIGLSSAEENISKWTLGMQRFKKYEGQISRAEFKLLEGLDVFNIKLKKYKEALDLGASPGGWSKVLIDQGIKVTAVDPAKLSFKDENLTHYKVLAEQFLETNDKEFDIIVNDMKMDVVDSCKIMNKLSSKLKNDGIGIMTFKLPKNKSKGKIIDGLREIKKSYKIVRAKQLFHNRNEITVLLEKIN